MRSENLKHLINLEKYKQNSKIHYPYPTISIVNLKELLDYKKYHYGTNLLISFYIVVVVVLVKIKMIRKILKIKKLKLIIMNWKRKRGII